LEARRVWGWGGGWCAGGGRRAGGGGLGVGWVGLGVGVAPGGGSMPLGLVLGVCGPRL